MAEEMSPKVSSEKFQESTMDFGVCLQTLVLDKKCKRLEWNDGTYIKIHDERLMIYKPEDKRLHPLTVSIGDIVATDWIVVGKQEDLS